MRDGRTGWTRRGYQAKSSSAVASAVERLEPRVLLSAVIEKAAPKVKPSPRPTAPPVPTVEYSLAPELVTRLNTPRLRRPGEAFFVDPSELQLEEPTPTAPTLGGSIEGITFDEDGNNNGGFLHIPPDPHGAVGPNHVVSVVNTSIEWHTKAGAQQNSQRLGKSANGSIVGSFFQPLSPVNGLFDPKVIYDQYNQRFVVVALERTDTAAGDATNTSRMLIAVSDDADPNGTWRYQAINTNLNIGGTNYWADYPGLAVDSGAIYITNNMFGYGAGTYGGSRLWILNKTNLYSGAGAATFTVHDPAAQVSLPGLAFTMQPAHMFGTAPGATGTFLVSSGWTSGDVEAISVIRLTNPLTTPTFSNTFLSLGDVSTTFNVPDAPQLGSANLVDAADGRLYNAVWRNNQLYFANTVSPGAGADAGTATARWYRVNATSSVISLADQGNVSGEDIAAGTRTFFPAVMVDSVGNMGVGFSASGPNIYPGAYYTARTTSDPAGTVQSSGVIAAGVAPYFRLFGGNDNRWGDYSGLALDPTNEATFWSFNEYALAQGTPAGTGLGRWGTRWGNFTVQQLASVPPTAPDLVAGLDTGASNSDNLTRLNNSGGNTLQFTVAGTVSGAVIKLYADGTLIGQATASGTTTTITTNNTFTLADGARSITATQTETGKTESAASTALAVTVDTVRPTVTGSTFAFETGPQRLLYTYSELTWLTGGAIPVTVQTVPGGATVPVTSSNAAATSHTFGSVLTDNNYRATLAASGVIDTAGNTLPANHVFDFFFLNGDFNRDRAADFADLGILLNNYNTSGKTFSQGDANYDGTVDFADLGILLNSYNKSLLAPSSPSVIQATSSVTSTDGTKVRKAPGVPKKTASQPLESALA